jgi:hypothetical protein
MCTADCCGDPHNERVRRPGGKLTLRVYRVWQYACDRCGRPVGDGLTTGGINVFVGLEGKGCQVCLCRPCASELRRRLGQILKVRKLYVPS